MPVARSCGGPGLASPDSWAATPPSPLDVVADLETDAHLDICGPGDLALDARLWPSAGAGAMDETPLSAWLPWDKSPPCLPDADVVAIPVLRLLDDHMDMSSNDAAHQNAAAACAGASAEAQALPRQAGCADRRPMADLAVDDLVSAFLTDDLAGTLPPDGGTSTGNGHDQPDLCECAGRAPMNPSPVRPWSADDIVLQQEAELAAMQQLPLNQVDRRELRRLRNRLSARRCRTRFVRGSAGSRQRGPGATAGAGTVTDAGRGRERTAGPGLGWGGGQRASLATLELRVGALAGEHQQLLDQLARTSRTLRHAEVLLADSARDPMPVPLQQTVTAATVAAAGVDPDRARRVAPPITDPDCRHAAWSRD